MANVNTQRFHLQEGETISWHAHRGDAGNGQDLFFFLSQYSILKGGYNYNEAKNLNRFFYLRSKTLLVQTVLHHYRFTYFLRPRFHANGMPKIS